ncbi:gp278 [Sphingomonas phage PAU]|uniref:gp278 n=1 Tax=Sphingomonas phage PAU TaxID=1150991 RepID=UPI0002573495|nr:gp278 [Sphingomonas phage PAU]AFF28276.1 gp278 [Sphingomonas phage PAU]
MKTILFENFRLLSKEVELFVKSIDEDFVEIDPSFKDTYIGLRDDLRMYSLLIQPELENIVVSSAFEHISSNQSFESQIGWFAEILFAAIEYRKDKKLKPIKVWIWHRSYDFIKWLNNDANSPKYDYLRQSIRMMIRPDRNYPIHIIFTDDGEHKDKLTILTPEMID